MRSFKDVRDVLTPRIIAYHRTGHFFNAGRAALVDNGRVNTTVFHSDRWAEGVAYLPAFDSDAEDLLLIFAGIDRR